MMHVDRLLRDWLLVIVIVHLVPRDPLMEDCVGWPNVIPQNRNNVTSLEWSVMHDTVISVEPHLTRGVFRGVSLFLR